MLQMLGRLMWIGVGAVAVKALEAGLKSHYFDAEPDSNGSGNGSTATGNGNASGTTPKRRATRRRATTKPAPSH